MSDFLKVFRIQLRARFSQKASSRKERWKNFGLGLVIVLSLGSLLFSWAFVLHGLFATLHQANMLDVGLLSIFIAGMLVVLIFGVVGVLGVLFQSKDISFLASLPLKQGAVFASKFFIVYLYELAVLIVAVLPAIIVYGIFTSGGVLYYIKATIAMLLLPMLPLILSTLISLVLMRFSGLSKRRDLFAVVGAFLLVIGYLVGQQFLMSKISTMSQDAIIALIMEAGSFVKVIGRSFPPALWAVNAVTLSGVDSLINWALYLASSLAAFALTCFIGSKIYLSGALAQLETAKKGKKVHFNKLKKKSRSPIIAICIREFKLILRSPVYALNSLIGVVLFPVMIFIFPMMSSTDPDLTAIDELMSSLPPSMLFVGAFGVGLVVCTMNAAASTVLSREGEHFWLSKVIPVPYRIQVYGKLLFTWCISAVTIVLCLIPALIMLPGTITSLIPAFICALMGAIPLTSTSMIIDIARPKLKWSSETEAIKQNLNVVLGMFASVALGFIFVVVSVFLINRLAEQLAIFLVFVFIGGVALVSTFALARFADYKYKRIEM
jgi:ABC-2 type transport system permease protein